MFKKLEMRQKRRLDVVFDFYSESSQKRELEAKRMAEEQSIDDFNTMSTLDSLITSKKRKLRKVGGPEVIISPIKLTQLEASPEQFKLQFND